MVNYSSQILPKKIAKTGMPSRRQTVPLSRSCNLPAPTNRQTILDDAESPELGGQSAKVSPPGDVRTPQRHPCHSSSRAQRVVIAAVCSALISTIGIGIVLGAIEQRVDVELNANSAMTGLITCVEAFLFWKYGLQTLERMAND